jgi:hypothetical protein
MRENKRLNPWKHGAEKPFYAFLVGWPALASLRFRKNPIFPFRDDPTRIDPCTPAFVIRSSHDS